MKTADKREREKRVVHLMIALYCRKSTGSARFARTAPRWINTRRAQRQMPLYGDQDFLLELQGALL